jgi:hypothetical protein
MHGRPASLSLQARGLRRITLLVPIGCAEGLLLLARELVKGLERPVSRLDGEG